MNGAIEADHYRDEIEALKKDPIVIAMSDELWNAPQSVKDMFWDHDAQPTMTMMALANTKYRNKVLDLGTTDNHRSIGGVAKAITALHKERVENGN